MKLSALVFGNILRKKTRLFMVIGSFAVALFLFGLLAVVRGAFNQRLDLAAADRLLAVNRAALTQPLPLAYEDRILKIHGVKRVAFDRFFGGIYQDEHNVFPQYAIDVDNQREVFPEFKVSDEQWKNFAADRQGAVAGAATAKRFGWKVGDRIAIKGTFYPGIWEFNLDGIYQGERPQDDETQFWFQQKLLEERLPAGRSQGKVGWFTILVDDPQSSEKIANKIDAEFDNSSFETHTVPESTFFAAWINQFGNIQFLVVTIGSIVFFILLLVTGSTMAIAVRERTAELAILKAIGYSDSLVLSLVILESMILAVLGGVLGLVAVKVFTLVVGDPTHGLLPSFYFPVHSLWTGLAVTLIAGAASGLIPAIAAMRLRIVDALRRV